MKTVPVSVELRPDPGASVSTVESILSELGAVVTSRGQATISARFARKRFRELFDTNPPEGTDGLMLTIPPELVDTVKSMAVMPKPTTHGHENR